MAFLVDAFRLDKFLEGDADHFQVGHQLGEGAKIVVHRDFPNVARDCPCFDCQSEYATLN